MIKRSGASYEARPHLAEDVVKEIPQIWATVRAGTRERQLP